MQLLNALFPAAVAILVVIFGTAPARAVCEQVCYSGLPCQVTEITGDYEVGSEICAGDLVLQNGSRIIVVGSSPRLISVDGMLRVVGEAAVVTQSSLLTPEKAPQAKSGDGGASYMRGPETDGPGNAGQGANGGNGEDGANGTKGQNGANAPNIVLRVNRFSGGVLRIVARGGRGHDGQDGGNGGWGGDGQQGGRAIPGQPFGCRSGPGHGGNGGKGGDAGRGGNGGDGGSGGTVALEASADQLPEIRPLVGKQILIDVQEGRHGVGGARGSPGKRGLFGYGGRGATGCEGREEERKGDAGADGAGASDGSDGRDGQPGNFLLSERK